MATGAVKGRRASVLLQTTAGSFTFNEVRNWSLTPTQEMIDASSADSSGWNEFITGQRGWVFTAESVYSGVTGGVGLDIRRLVQSLAAGGELQHFQLAVDVPSTNTGFNPSTHAGIWRTSTGASPGRVALITNYQVGGSYTDLTLFEVEIRGTRVLLYTSAAL